MSPAPPYYKRKLPHIQPPGSILFVTFRTAGSLLTHVEARLKATAFDLREQLKSSNVLTSDVVLLWKKHFQFIDESLDRSTLACYLNEPGIPEIVLKTIYKGEALGYFILHRFCIMPNHVHLLLEPMPLEICPGFPLRPDWPALLFRPERQVAFTEPINKRLNWRELFNIMKSLKGASSKEIRKQLELTGPVWRDESYDHWIRDDGEYARVISYIDWNPVKAGLCKTPEDWRWSSAGQSKLL